MTAFIVNSIILGSVMLFGCLGETITEKSGHLNLGIPGIMCMGLTGGCLGANIYMGMTNIQSASWVLMILMIVIFSSIFSVLGGLIYAFLTVTLKANQNISGLALTTFGGGFAMFFIKQFIKSDGNFAGIRRVIMKSIPSFKESLGWFTEIFFSYDIFVVLAVALAVVAWFTFKKTKTGLSLRAVGENPATADATGINVNGYKYGAILIGSIVAGFGGCAYTLGSAGTGIFNSTSEVLGYGWLAIALVIFTLWRPLLSILGSFLFGGLLYLAKGGIVLSGIWPYWLKILPYFITIVVLIITSIRDNKENQPPASLGVNYFREER